MRVALSVCLSVLLVLVSGFARADELQWYTVEVIVFRLLDESGLYQERWPQDPGLPAAESARTLNPLRSTASLDGEAFVLLGPEEFQLGAAAAAVARSRAYKPLLHVAWRQPGFPQAEAVTVHLHSQLSNPYRTDESGLLRQAGAYTGFGLEPAGTPVPRLPSAVLDGTLRLYRARYLHVDADLVYYRAPRLARVIGAEPEPSLFRLTESRRMRSSELHFLDHPLFGVLVEVRPYTRATEQAPVDPQSIDGAAVSE